MGKIPLSFDEIKAFALTPFILNDKIHDGVRLLTVQVLGWKGRFCAMCESLRQNDKRVVGTRQILKKFACDGIETLIIADNAQERIIQPLVELAAQKNAAVLHVKTMDELGRLCGIAVGAAAAGILK